MKDQTAVTWLIRELAKNMNFVPMIHWHSIGELIEQAKKIEKEQQRLIYEGLLQNVGTSIKQSDLPTFEQYYNETYEK